MATITVALKDEVDGEWYSFLLSHEEETRLSQDPDFASMLLNSVKKNKSNATPNSEGSCCGPGTTITTVSTLPSTSQDSNSLDMDIISEVQEDDGEEKFTWSYQSVLTLMSLFKQYKDKFESPEMKKKNVWREISKKMQEQGYIISPEQCDKKWRNLRCTYKAVLVKKTLNPSHKKTWEFFNEMHDICQEDPSLTEATNPLTGTPLGYGSKSVNASSIPQNLPLYQLVQSTPGTSILKRTLVDNNLVNLAPKKRKPTILTSGQGGNDHSEVVVLSEPRSTPGIEPQWFASFRQEMRKDNERNMTEIKAMHSESLKLLRDRNDILRTLISLLDPANNNNTKKKDE